MQHTRCALEQRLLDRDTLTEKYLSPYSETQQAQIPLRFTPYTNPPSAKDSDCHEPDNATLPSNRTPRK
jgi:hypothetical protein